MRSFKNFNNMFFGTKLWAESGFYSFVDLFIDNSNDSHRSILATNRGFIDFIKTCKGIYYKIVLF